MRNGEHNIITLNNTEVTMHRLSWMQQKECGRRAGVETLRIFWQNDSVAIPVTNTHVRGRSSQLDPPARRAVRTGPTSA